MILKVVHMLLVGQIEACSIGHVHLEAAGSEALSLGLLDLRNLLLGVTYRTIVLL